MVPLCLKVSILVLVPKNSDGPHLESHEMLVLSPINDTIHINVDPHQYAYRKNRSVSHTVPAVIHSALTHLESRDSCVRLLFLDFKSASVHIQ